MTSSLKKPATAHKHKINVLAMFCSVSAVTGVSAALDDGQGGR